MPPAGADDVMRFGDFELRPAERALCVRGEPVALGSRAFDVLLVLAQRRERLVTKQELLDLVWPGLVVEEHNIATQISTLRKVLGAQVIATVPGRGYRFTAPIAGGAVEPPVRAIAFAAPIAVPTRLPHHLMPLLGRADDLAALDALLKRSRLVTLVGAGGIGKSLLTQHLLSDQAGAYAHGVCWVELASVGDAAAVPQRIADALGVRMGAGDPLAGLCTAVSSLTMLVALDNAEHLLVEVARTAAALLDAAPGLRLLVTSQAPLQLAAEHVYRVGPLATPTGPLPASMALTFAAVELFAERARAADARFMLGDDSAPAAIELCRTLDGMPLAIELAAARAPLLGVTQLAASMQQRLRLLTRNRDATAPARQQTLRAALEWSHGLLDERERIVFRRLGVMAGSASLALIQQVVAEEQGPLDVWAVLDALGTLVDRSLVVVMAEHELHVPRYRLLESARMLAAEHVAASNEEAALRQRHADAVCELFNAALDEVSEGRCRFDDMVALLEPDFDNARAAMAWALRHDSHTAVALAPPFANALTLQRHAEVDRIWQSTEPCLNDSVPLLWRARWALRVSIFRQTRQAVLAWQWAQRAAAAFREIGDSKSLARALCVQAGVRIAEATAPRRAALEELRRLARPEWPALLRMHVAEAQCLFALHHDDLATVELQLRCCIALAEEAGSDSDRNAAAINLADLALANGDAAEAARLGFELEARWRESRQVRSLATCRMNLVAALLALGDITKARAVVERGWPLAPAVALQQYWMDSLALLAALEGRPRASVRLRACSDAAYAAKNEQREVNERRSAERSDSIARAALGDAEFERLRGQAVAALSDEAIAALAFATDDATD
jgi:predicted ATPase/DNA-binding winged helix-turn-helix (wHTH) protein